MPSTIQPSENTVSACATTNDAQVTHENPEWLTAELFEKLKGTIPKYQKIQHFEAKPALAAGENYSTIMLRVSIDVGLTDDTTKSLSYMMKLPHGNEMLQDLMRGHNIFEIEYRVYHEVVPEFEQLYRAVGVEVNFSAKCYYVETPSEFGVILLEDLCPFGYKNANRLEGLDLEHTKAVLKRLAQWHAASAVRVATNGLYPELFLKGMFSEFTESQQGPMKAYYDSFKPSLFASIRTLKGHEEYIDDLEQAFDSIPKEFTRGSQYDPSEFNVLNHGDCWVNNVMFKYDSEGKIEDTLLIDYQMVNYGSPAKDLIYFLLSSTRCDLKVKQFDYFIRFYHDHLVKNLQLLEYSKNLPTLKEMHIAVMKYGKLALISTIGIMAVALLESRSSANIDGFVGNTESAVSFRNAMFTNTRYRQHLEVLMPWMSNRGVFEVES